MDLPRLYPILDTESLHGRGVTIETAAAAFLEGDAGILQIRHKGHWNRDVFESAKQVARLCREAGAPLIVNDRADFALLLKAGLHVGQDDLAPGDARRLLGPGAMIGFSSHNADQLSAAGGASARCSPAIAAPSAHRPILAGTHGRMATAPEDHVRLIDSRR
jgi:thiamine-phosphate pyrophosphorylase